MREKGDDQPVKEWHPLAALGLLVACLVGSFIAVEVTSTVTRGALIYSGSIIGLGAWVGLSTTIGVIQTIVHR